MSAPTMRPGGASRRPVAAKGDIAVEPPPPGRTLPATIRATREGLDLATWIGANRALVDCHLAEAGAVLLRDFTPAALDGFATVISAATAAQMEYRYRSTPRRSLHPGVYSSTEYPASQTIPLHNEMSYARQWPGRIVFGCIVAPEQGGQTPICDSRKVYARIPETTRARFADAGVLYRRCYHEGIDLRWQDVFQTQAQDDVEAYCRAHDIAWEWTARGLVTWQRCQAVARHPASGAMVWFNQAHLFHVSALPPTLREQLVALHGEDSLPRQAFLGTGAPIAEEDLAAIREAYAQESVQFDWQRGDVLLLDNVLAAHGRAPYAGARQIVVGLGDPSETQTAAAG